ncbi:MAG: branched-chain amino acid ABC transporter permease [Alphaproteobacteria bacterium]
MNFDIALLLIQDGLTNGAIYALLALAILLVFAVTRVLYVPQGEFVAFGALTLATLQQAKVPGTAYLVAGIGALTMAMELIAALRERRVQGLATSAALYVAIPLALLGIATWLAPRQPPLLVQVLLTLALVVPLGPMTYRLAIQPIANATVLVLLFVAVAVHYVLMGLGLVFFGAEGWRTPSFTDLRVQLGPMTASGQSILVLAASAILIVLLWQFFGRTLWGKALRATAMNRTGARLVGIPTEASGRLAFTLAALLGAFSGVLIAPFTTIYYDSGFLIALKGFVGTVIGGMTSYPLAALGALLVGLLESFASFYASALKEVIVFSLLIPFLLWRSFVSRHVEEEHDE